MIIRVKVNPGSNREKFEKINDYEFKISVKERAEDDKANIRVLNLLSNELGINVRNIVIKNPRARDKIIEYNKD